MIIKYYNGLQSLLCILTTALLFWFTLPWALQGHTAYERTDRMSVMAEKAINESKDDPCAKLKHLGIWENPSLGRSYKVFPPPKEWQGTDDEYWDAVVKCAPEWEKRKAQTDLSKLASKENIPPVVRIEKTFDDHVATVAHSLEILSPLSSLFISVWLWRKKRKDDKAQG